MFVRMLTSIAGVSFAHYPGDVVEWDDATAQRLIQSEQAELIEGSSDAPRRPGKPDRKKEGKSDA